MDKIQISNLTKLQIINTDIYNSNDSHSHYVERKEEGTKEYRMYYIYMKFKNKQIDDNINQNSDYIEWELIEKGDRNVLHLDLRGDYTSVHKCANASSCELQICFIHFTIRIHISIKIKKNKLEENSCEYLTGHGKDKNFLSMKV